MWEVAQRCSRSEYDCSSAGAARVSEDYDTWRACTTWISTDALGSTASASMAVDLYTDAKPRIGGRTVTPCLSPLWEIDDMPQHIAETLCSRPSLSSDVREPYVG